ncbi:M15 family metallopeptidase [Nocardioides lijunqiniae]|uniref:M15 family metallopeptidase n=1 Tax=Nocardioides lijunqiniae TaxID=2760832 RepID=UPI00187886BC|nr:M15 family metallopeptidase [Nocardioides lijunqiniae]
MSARHQRWVLGAVVGVGLAALGGCASTEASATDRAPLPSSPTSVAQAAPPAEREAPPAFDLTAHSTIDPRSIWVVVNKRLPITPADYRPDPMAIVEGYQVSPAAAPALERMLAAARSDGTSMRITSAFRSHSYQEGVHEATVARLGRRAAERISARPGHSEHQTGLAVDLGSLSEPGCNFDACFAATREGRWLARHAVRHGFVVRYTEATTEVTGYQPEPWHLRYVGRPLAAELARTGATLEETLGLPGGDYPR